MELPERRILLVEDNPSDVRLLEEAFAEADVACTIDVAPTVREATKYLRKLEAKSRLTRPDLVILDLALPDGGGIEVLRMLRDSTELRGVPCDVFTTSEHPDDVLDARESGATRYLVKPIDMAGMVEFAEELARTWFVTR